MDTILYNGLIHTMRNNEIVSAIAVKDGLIFAVGNDEQILALKKPETKIVDLKQQLMIPGFNDSHLHILSYGLNKRRVDLTATTSIREMIEKGRDYLKEFPNCPVLYGRGWNQDYFTEVTLPTRADLDQLSQEIPIVFIRVCGHLAVTNTRALEFFKINERPCPFGGSIDLEQGIFRETAIDMLSPDSPPIDEIKDIILDVTKEMNSQGITSVQTDDFGYGYWLDVITAYQELVEKKNLSVRIYQQCLFYNYQQYEDFFTTENPLIINPNFYNLGPTKILSDGSLGARTALLSQVYHDDPSTSGIACFSQNELDDIVLLSYYYNRSVAVHCIGDEAINKALNSIEKARESTGKKLRDGIVHCQITNQQILTRMSSLDIMAYLQPIFLDYDLHIVEQRVGKQWAKSSYAFKSMRDLAIPISLGTDCPVEKFNPLNNIYCAVTRKDLNGWPQDGFNREQALTVSQAVFAYTGGSAYCSYEEEKKGCLEAGYFADMTVLNCDIFNCDPEEIKAAKVVLTVVAGEIVFKAKDY